LQSQQNGFTHKGDKQLAGKPSSMIYIHTGVSRVFFSTPCPQGQKGPPILVSGQLERFLWEKGLDSENDHYFTSSAGIKYLQILLDSKVI
jgi:hypothetical protein